MVQAGEAKVSRFCSDFYPLHGYAGTESIPFVSVLTPTDNDRLRWHDTHVR